MLILLLATLSGPTTHEVPRTVAAPVKPCRRTAPQWANKDAPVAPRKLTQEPAAEAYLGVLHIAKGCETPIKVSDRQRRAR